ncbi:hypothetical protein A0128_16080 [Leptospira tipperaryensis]|uniref:Uncharacterized protein n=1 Tax=Leptospira tipperaryensis TaxID=2564040 RepID=A0A1D7V061_9LEPT|nr:hypothetical protein A0128_16080 [Leptospira tipperaryensis]
MRSYFNTALKVGTHTLKKKLGDFTEESKNYRGVPAKMGEGKQSKRGIFKKNVGTLTKRESLGGTKKGDGTTFVPRPFQNENSQWRNFNQGGCCPSIPKYRLWEFLH